MNLSRSVTLVQFKGSTATDRSSQGKDARAEQQAKLMHGFLLQKNPARLPAWSTRQTACCGVFILGRERIGLRVCLMFKH